jgi:pimeloyl-ACP methyl ester carboxylesterase
MQHIKHQTLQTNGIKMHLAEAGEGPLVVLLHGWPESWYSWRNQLIALADAGYHAVAPDQRGYGQSDRPADVEKYNILELTADIVGLVQSLEHDTAVVVGHDWGSVVAAHCALLRPDLFSKLVLMSVPYLPRTRRDRRPTDVMKFFARDRQFYQLYFQEPGIAEKEFETDIKRSLTMILYSASGDPPEEERGSFFFEKSEGLLDACTFPKLLPDWLTEADLEFYTQEFERSGFRGGLNWYRNIDMNWRLTQFLSDAKLLQPSVFIGGDLDGVITLYKSAFESMESNMPNLWRKVLIPDAGHWIQQERSDVVSEILLEFLRS